MPAPTGTGCRRRCPGRRAATGGSAVACQPAGRRKRHCLSSMPRCRLAPRAGRRPQRRPAVLRRVPPWAARHGGVRLSRPGHWSGLSGGRLSVVERDRSFTPG